MNAAQAIRDAQARASALRQYAAAHERFAEREQMAALKGEPYEQEGAHQFGLRLLRAWIAEQHDPTPEGLV